jgi:macrolide-specific efflux system membrane fusion protein
VTPRTRRILLALAVLGAGAGLAVVRAGSTRDPLADFLTEPVTRGDVERTVEATGSLRPARLVAVGAQVSGRITAMRVHVGDSVAAGDLIATIDDVTKRNDLRTAEANLANIQAQKTEKEAALTYADQAMRREETMLAQRATSRDSFDAARKTLDSAKAQIAALEAQIVQAEAKIDSAKIDLGYTRITAPIAGTVLLVTAQEGQTVNAVQSAPTIVVLGQIDRMTVRTEISEADVPKVRVGQPVSFSILGDTRRWQATLASIDPAPDTLRSDSEITSSASSSSSVSSSSSTSSSSAIYYYGRFDVPNPEGLLRTYMTAQVRISTGSAKDVLTVPTAALSVADGTGERSVEVVGADGHVVTRRVSIGLDDKIRAEVRSGLAEGERVITGRRGTEAKSSAMPPPPGGM